ncbi:MAG: hypothetical protein ACOZF0_05575 [Thermodesulfobacteriota bacterium]
MFQKFICIVLLIPLIGISAHAQEARSIADSDFFELKTRIEANYFSYDEEVIRSLLNQALEQIKQYPADWHPRYYAGLINIQLGNIARAHDIEAAHRHYLKALAHLQAAHEWSPIAENTVVLADVYGKLASLKTLKMLYYGSKSKSYLMDAFKMSEHSPKNYLLAGIESMWTPMIFGGSKKRAREFLSKALELEPAWRETDPLIVRWATPPEILAHQAQLEILCEAPAQAKRYITKALSHIPDYGFVLRDVIPQLNEGLPDSRETNRI